MVQNSLAQDYLIAGVFEEIDDEFKDLLKTAKLTPKPLLVCSGGTSSRCTAPGHWTLDLRKNYQRIDFDQSNKTVEIEGGITMTSLLKELSKYGRTFPIGMSGLPGLGYILTGGISPLSRSYGLAVDQILEIKGVWGTGECFKISKPTSKSNFEDHLLWRGLCGAAPFLGIVTNLTLRTQPLTTIKVLQTTIKKDQLTEAIQQAQDWPDSISLQWIWGDFIKLYVVFANGFSDQNNTLEKLEKDFSRNKLLQVSEVLGQQDLPAFTLENSNKKDQSKLHNEVVGLLGPSWDKNCSQLIDSLESLISIRPNKNCFIASQQLGGASSQISRSSTSFVHRQAIWKPWINASWQAGNQKDREKSLAWLIKAWRTLEPHCPGVHLAQMHQHLPWHLQETQKAYEEWLPGLQSLKSRYDPQGILPRL